VLKASAGACEHVPLIAVRDLPAFIRASNASGWTSFAAVPPPPPPLPQPHLHSPRRRQQQQQQHSSSSYGSFTGAAAVTATLNKYMSLRQLQQQQQQQTLLLVRKPCLLVLGSEGHGVRPALRRLVQCEIGIDGPPRYPSSSSSSSSSSLDVFNNMDAAAAGGIGGGLDSLNVAVAAGILCQAFTRIATITTIAPTLADGGSGSGSGSGVSDNDSDRREADKGEAIFRNIKEAREEEWEKAEEKMF
jgi:hypothetical protein